MKTSTLSFLLGLSLTNLVTARTDLSGCVSSEIVVDYYASYLWYVPGTGEICSFLDCGGGRAPPKTNQPGCPLYKGTATVTPSYIEGWGPNGKQIASTTTAAATTSASVEATSTSAVSFETSTESSSGSSSTSSESASGTQTSGSLITAAPTSSPVVSMTTSTSAMSSAANSTSAASSTPTGNAANTPASNVGIVAILAAAIGAMVL